MKKVNELNFGFPDAENYKRRETKQLFNKLFIQNEFLDQLCQPEISFLIGDKGTGKTSMIKNISKDINKDIFFIPNNLIDQVVLNPEFINFIKKNNECILVFDDFELAIDNSRYNPIVNNIIQMVDSLISDIVSVNIILIFNTEDVSEIEDSIDCNNIIDVVEFEHLNEEESNKLSEYLGDKTKYKNKTRLIDIIRGKNTNNKKRVGF